MYGAIIGDVGGSIDEFHNIKMKEAPSIPASEFSDRRHLYDHSCRPRL